MAQTIKFGTDGWRGVIADDYTFANLRVCAQAWADELKRDRPERGCVIAYDNRFHSENFARAAAEVLSANGIKAILTDRATPTPTLSFTILDRQAAGGIIITASHNPAIWNGFKVRGDYGGAAGPDVLSRLEEKIVQIQSAARPSWTPREDLIETYDAGPRYEGQVRRLLDVGPIRDAGITIVHDAMYGAGSGWIERFVGGGKTRVVGVNAERNPAFPGINPEPITKNLDAMLRAVPGHQAELGIATDGDADRLGVCDEKGHFIDQLRAYSLLTLYLLEVRNERGAIVKTLSTSSMLDRLGELYGVPVHETGVGFKFVAPKMIETDALIGGEESGGYAFRGHVPERDGILAGLYIADMCVRLGKRPSELIDLLFSKVGPHFYDRIDAQFAQERRNEIVGRLQRAAPADLAGEKVVRSQTTDGFKWIGEDGSWLLIRFSGTEPIMRVYTETRDERMVPRILDQGKEMAGL